MMTTTKQASTKKNQPQLVSIVACDSMIEEEEQVDTPMSFSGADITDKASMFTQQQQSTSSKFLHSGTSKSTNRASYKAILSSRGWTSTNTVPKDSTLILSDEDDDIEQDKRDDRQSPLGSEVSRYNKVFNNTKRGMDPPEGASNVGGGKKTNNPLDRDSNHSIEERLRLSQPKAMIRSVTGGGADAFTRSNNHSSSARRTEDEATADYNNNSDEEIMKTTNEDEDEGLNGTLHQYSMQDLQMASSFPDPQQYPEMSLGTETETSSSEDERDQVSSDESDLFKQNGTSSGSKTNNRIINSKNSLESIENYLETNNDCKDKAQWKSHRMNLPSALVYNNRGYLDDDDDEDNDDVDEEESRNNPKLQLLETSPISASQASISGPGRTFEEIYKELEKQEEEERMSWKNNTDPNTTLRNEDDTLSNGHSLPLYQSSLSTSYDDDEVTSNGGMPATKNTTTVSRSKVGPTSGAINGSPKIAPTSFDDTKPKINPLPVPAAATTDTKRSKDKEKIEEPKSPTEDPSTILRYLSSAQSDDGPNFWLEDDIEGGGGRDGAATHKLSPRSVSPSRAIPTLAISTAALNNSAGAVSPLALMSGGSSATTPRVRNIFQYMPLGLEKSQARDGSLSDEDYSNDISPSPLSPKAKTHGIGIKGQSQQNKKPPLATSISSRSLSPTTTRNRRKEIAAMLALERLKSDDVHDIYDDLETTDAHIIEMKSVDDTISLVTMENNFSVDGKTNDADQGKVLASLPYDKSSFARRKATYSDHNRTSWKKNSSKKDEGSKAVCVKVILPCLVLIFIVAVVVGGVCGSGQCVRGNSSSASTGDDTPHVPSIGGDSEPKYVAFQTTEELYGAIDVYLSGFEDTSTTGNGQRLLVKNQYGEYIGDWDVSFLTDFTQAFDAERDPPFDARSQFDQDISKWNVSLAVSMRGMFRNTVKFNQPLDNWDVSNVLDMSYMFQSAIRFNQSLKSWNVGKVQDMAYMFKEAIEFNGDISTWDVSHVQDMYSMFARAISFNSDISRWDVSSVADMGFMFNRAAMFKGDISQWNVGKVASMQVMFQRADSFNGDISKWNVSNTVDMKYMFYGATAFTSDLQHWDVSKVTDMFSMFNQAVNFNGDVSKWNVSNVVDMDSMFQLASSFKGDLSLWDVSKCVNMAYMFFGAKRFNSDISKWNVARVETMHRMFRHASSFNQDVSNWNVASLIDAAYMFANASSFDQDLCIWGGILTSTKTSKSNSLADTTSMFEYTSCPTTDSPNVNGSLSDGPWCYECKRK